MSILVAGTLKSPTGEVIAGAQITLTALTTSPDLLAGVSASAVTSDTGYYGMNVLPGAYSLTVAVNGKSQVYGSFRLDGTETTVTLNMVLRRNLVEVSIPDALLVDFRQIQNNVADDLETMRQLELSASGSAEKAARTATEAKGSADAAARSETNAADSEKKAEQFARNLQDTVAKAGDSASAAALSAKEAGEQATAATGAATEAANQAKAAQEAAANAALSEKNAADSALTAKTSETSAADSATKAGASEKAAALHEQTSATHETNAGQSAADAALSAGEAGKAATQATISEQHVADVADTATKAASRAQADAQSARQDAKTAQESAAAATQASTITVAAKDEVFRQVTTFDEHVSQQTSVFTQAATDAIAKAARDINATGETVKQSVQTQGQELVDRAGTEAGNAAQSAKEALTAGQSAQKAATDAGLAQEEARTSATAAKSSETASSDSADASGKSALEAKHYAEQAAASGVLKTDGTTITGDGRTTPLAVNLDYLCVGSYLFACLQYQSVNETTEQNRGIRMQSMGGSVWDSYVKTIVPGTKLIPDYIKEYGSHYLGVNQFSPTIPGTWRCQGLVSIDENAWTVFQRIA
ncbi:phage tail protein [Salmonella enterica]|nr:phage tail protein [Salmonella enterica]EIW3445163.1 carboxypeptidase regulatory-like domain-containing protein [Salmonella enterica]